MAIVSTVRRIGNANFVILSYLYGYLSVVNIGYSIFLELEMFKFVSSNVISFCLLSVTAFLESPVVKSDRTVEIFHFGCANEVRSSEFLRKTLRDP